ncbi:MAG: O-methyltransferase [Bdellovibrionales bacterium]
MRVTTSKENYLNAMFGLRGEEFDRISKRLKEDEVGFMSISAFEARILQFLIKSFDVRKVVEIGTLYGYSALAMAQVLPEDGTIVTLEANPKRQALAKVHFESSAHGVKIRSLCGDAHALLGDLTDGPFDMVFIDAEKTGYVEYLNWAEAHVRPGGLIVGDNTFLWGGVWDECQRPNVGAHQIAVMKEFNRRLADSSKYNSIFFPTEEGLLVAQKL